MSAQTGLAFEQAPPFALPLRFFLTAPLFLFAAGLLVALAPNALAARWMPQALALTHAVTLGFLAMAMLGALAQMLPVVAGSPMPAPRLVAWASHAPLTLGSIALMAGFLTGERLAFGLAVALLGTGFAVFLVAAAASLVRAVAGATVNGIRLAAAGLAIAVPLGIALALPHAGGRPPPDVDATLAAHVALGLVGWVLLLVVGVAYQVVPMFQITPPYPPRLSRWLAPGLFGLVLLYAAAPWLPAAAGRAAEAGIGAGVLLFAFATLRLQMRRRRRLPDVTFDYWRVGMASLIACVAGWTAGRVWPAWGGHEAFALLLGIVFLGGFALSVVIGMLYKIVPFLAWFHLQAQSQARAGSIPTMKEMITARSMRWQFRLHLVACALLLAAVPQPRLAIAAGGALSLSALLLWLNLLSAVRRFSRHGGRLS